MKSRTDCRADRKELSTRVNAGTIGLQEDLMSNPG